MGKVLLLLTIMLLLAEIVIAIDRSSSHCCAIQMQETEIISHGIIITGILAIELKYTFFIKVIKE